MICTGDWVGGPEWELSLKAQKRSSVFALNDFCGPMNVRAETEVMWEKHGHSNKGYVRAVTWERHVQVAVP